MGTHHSVRSVESATKEVFVNVNDLLISLLRLSEAAHNEQEKAAYRNLIKLLTDIREREHKTHA